MGGEIAKQIDKAGQQFALGHALAFGGLRVGPIKVGDDPLGLGDGGVQIDGGIAATFTQGDLMHEEIRQDGMAGAVAAFEWHVGRSEPRGG